MRRFALTALRWVFDLAVVVAVVACILHMSRRRAVSCAWERMRASCTVEVEDSLGRIESESIHGVRDAAYRAKNVVGLVTDAENKGEHALFGTHEITLDSETDAEKLRAFAHNRDPDRIDLVSGVSRPRVVTALLLAALLVYGVVSRFMWSALARRAR